MSFDLEQVDVDGALREAEEAVAGDTRLDFLKKAGIGAGALAGGGAVLGALAPGAMAAAKPAGSGAPPSSFGKGDIGILNYALTLEYLESAFYSTATKNNVAKGDAQLSQILKTTTTDEAAHVAFLKKALGKSAVKKPNFDFGSAVTDPKTFAATAYVLENTGVRAYSGQAANIKTPDYVLAALSIWAIEARHAGAIAVYLGKGIDDTGSFQKGLPASAVLKAVKATKFIKS